MTAIHRGVAMLERPTSVDARYKLLSQLRNARREFHLALTRDADTRERTFAPVQLLRAVHMHVSHLGTVDARARPSKLFALCVLLYGALDWHFAGCGVDIEADVQLERIRQNHLHGGADADDRLCARSWSERLRKQALRLEQHIADADQYGIRLVKLTALVQAALEAASRHLRLQEDPC